MISSRSSIYYTWCFGFHSFFLSLLQLHIHFGIAMIKMASARVFRAMHLIKHNCCVISPIAQFILCFSCSVHSFYSLAIISFWFLPLFVTTAVEMRGKRMAPLQIEQAFSFFLHSWIVYGMCPNTLHSCDAVSKETIEIGIVWKISHCHNANA